MAAVEQLKTLATLQDSSLAGNPPAPNETFTSKIIHPRNLELEARRESARVLSKKELATYSQQLNKITATLDAADYFNLVQRAKVLWDQYRDLVDQIAKTDDETELDELATKKAAMEQRLALYKSQIDPLRPAYQKQQHILNIFQDHKLAVERKRLHAALQKEMADEAEKFATIIVETWDRLGFKHEFLKGKKLYCHHVSFSETHILPDAIWYKIQTTRKAAFGFKNALPYGVRAAKLVDEETLQELSVACQRQVTGQLTMTNGAWVTVHRLSSRDGIIEHVGLQQLLDVYPHKDRERFPMPVGVAEGRRVDWIMLSQHPHFLVGGSTGNGKSNLTNAWICTLIQKHTPEELRLVLIDLKEGGAEFAPYADIPHLLRPVVATVEEAVEVLTQVEALRAERMAQIAKAHCRNIFEYNSRHPNHQLYRVLVIIDEYARIKARGKELIEIADRVVGEITALGRAAGIHILAATQSPYVNILPGTTKANMALRLAFALPSVENSKSIIGNGDAYGLPDIPGRAVVAVGSQHWQVQTPHCTPENIKQALEIAKAYDNPGFVELEGKVDLHVFDEAKLLDVALNYLGGNLGAKPIYEAIKDSERVSRGEVQAMVKRITSTQREVEIDGETYKIIKQGTGFRLVAESP